MEEKEKRIEELEKKLAEAESSKGYWVAEATERSEKITKLKMLLKLAIDEL